MKIERTYTPIKPDMIGLKIVRVRSHVMVSRNVIPAHRLDIKGGVEA